MGMKKIGLCILSVLTIGWMLLIFGFSAQSGVESSRVSAIIAKPLVEFFTRINGVLTENKQAELYIKIDGILRIVAHFSEYAVLGVLLNLLVRFVRVSGLWIPWILGTVYAISDEWHQYYTPGRASDPTDVLIDSCGVLCGVLLCKIIIKYRRTKYVHDERPV